MPYEKSVFKNLRKTFCPECEKETLHTVTHHKQYNDYVTRDWTVLECQECHNRQKEDEQEY